MICDIATLSTTYASLFCDGSELSVPTCSKRRNADSCRINVLLVNDNSALLCVCNAADLVRKQRQYFVICDHSWRHLVTIRLIALDDNSREVDNNYHCAAAGVSMRLTRAMNAAP